MESLKRLEESFKRQKAAKEQIRKERRAWLKENDPNLYELLTLLTNEFGPVTPIWSQYKRHGKTISEQGNKRN